MTENPQPPKRGGIAWQKARRLLRSALDDWRESFTPGELAVLQYPREGQDHEKRIALRNQRAMIDAIKASIEQGEVEAVTGTREVSIWETVLDSRASRGGRFASDTWLERDFAPRTVQVEKKETREFQTITRPIFAAWLRFSGFGDNEGQEKPSEHVRAWLGPEWKEGPGDADARKSILRAIIADMQSLDPNIPRGEKPLLPGNLLGFHGLCIGRNRALFYKATTTFDEYRKGICTFAQKGPPQLSDLEYYKNMAIKMGVKWETPPKAKSRA